MVVGELHKSFRLFTSSQHFLVYCGQEEAFSEPIWANNKAPSFINTTTLPNKPRKVSIETNKQD